jgi:two-component system sensor histidine kinase CpxA
VRSLFTKFLLWFLAAMVITTVGFVIITTRSFTAARGRGHVFGRMLSVQLEEARRAFEQGGRPALASFLERFDSEFQAHGILTDSTYHDLATGQDRHDLVEKAERRARIFQPPVIARASRDGQYWFFLIARGRPGFSFIPPEYLWIVGAMVLLSYLLALHLTSPLRRLQKAVERFGKGDLGARVGSRRHDEVGSLARTFDQMADRLETLLTAERRLLLDISHELRSPLARLSVATELARSGEPEAREAAINRIEKEAGRLNALVGELLQVTRAEGDPSSLRKEPVRVDELLANLVGDCSVEAEARGCRLEMRKPPPVTIRGDAELMRRAVENVVRNAIRHAPQGSPVEIWLENGAPGARIRVRDYGPGVPDEHLPHIFDPFYRVDTDRNRTSGGVGLGLAIARRAVELHKGRIEAHNSNPGLVMEIDLPPGA